MFEKTCATTQKNVKSHVFLKSEKNVKRRRPTYSFTGRLGAQSLSPLYSITETETETQHLNISFARVCNFVLTDWSDQPKCSAMALGSQELNYSDHWAKRSLLGDVLRTKLLLMTFYDFWYVISKKRKKSCFFLKSEKNEKIRRPPIIEHWSYRLLAERDIAYRVIVVAGVPLSAALLSPHAASEASETLAIIIGRASHGLGAVDRLRADMTACRARCVLAGALARPPPLPVVATQHTHTVGIRYETEMTIIIIIIIIIKVKAVSYTHLTLPTTPYV